MGVFPTLKRPAPKPAAAPAPETVTVAPAVETDETHDDDGRLILTSPLQPAERPVPTVLRLGPPKSAARTGLPRKPLPPGRTLPWDLSEIAEMESAAVTGAAAVAAPVIQQTAPTLPKPTLPKPTLPRPVMPRPAASAVLRDYRGRVVVPAPPPERYVEHKGYMGRMDLIDPDDIPF